ncbi:MAG: ABC transporter permease [Lachnospiraceae bacterium]|nr:ABC transporter permease [Lachnospiraceae bacterium]
MVYDPYELDPSSILQPPSVRHLCGTDDLGRDLLSRLIYGGRYSLLLGTSGAVFGLVLGCIFGCVAGYFGKWVDTLIMRTCDVMMSIPGSLLSIIISSVLGPGFVNTMLALSVGQIPGKIRMLRAQILRERGEEYLEACEAYNCSKVNIMFRHLLPNTISPLLVGFTMGIGGTIMAASGLSYLGLGVQPPTPEWGALLSAGRTYINNYPHLILFPGLIIMIFVWCVNLFGDGLRDAMDPKLKT